jgi:hypothetical protein
MEQPIKEEKKMEEQIKEETTNHETLLRPKAGALSRPTGLEHTITGLDNPKVIRAELPALSSRTDRLENCRF